MPALHSLRPLIAASSTRRTRLRMLSLALAILAALAAAPASADGWTGYMNVFNNNGGSQGGYISGQPWGVSDLKTTVNTSNPGTIIGDNLTLAPNYNAYADSLGGSDADRAFWTDSTDGGVTPGPNGNKWLAASTYVETNPIAISSYTLTGTVDAYSLSSAYSAEAYIIVLDPGQGFNTVLNDRVTLPTSGSFTVTSDLSTYQGLLLQTGFSVNGLNANPADEGVLGSVTVTVTQPVPEPSAVGLALAGIGVAAAVRFRKRRAISAPTL